MCKDYRAEPMFLFSVVRTFQFMLRVKMAAHDSIAHLFFRNNLLERSRLFAELLVSNSIRCYCKQLFKNELTGPLLQRTMQRQRSCLRDARLSWYSHCL